MINQLTADACQALRTFEGQQIKGFYSDRCGGRCALGVMLSVVPGVEFREVTHDGGRPGLAPYSGPSAVKFIEPDDVDVLFNWPKGFAQGITDRNDYVKMTFPEIADWVENELKDVEPPQND